MRRMRIFAKSNRAMDLRRNSSRTSWGSTRIVLVTLLAVTAAVFVVEHPVGAGTARSDTSASQRGFALIWDAGYNGPQIDQSLAEMPKVGANWVQFTPSWGQQATNSSVIASTGRTMPDANLERAITLAHQRGLKVQLTPHLELPVPELQSRSEIRPDDRAAWFASYTAFIGHYADLARRLQVDQFAVGSELASISDDRPGWLSVIKDVRSRYNGPILYAAEPGEYARVPFWDAVDLIGIDAYWPLSAAPTTDAEALQRAWEPIKAELAAFSAQQNRRIVFTEAGFTSQRGTTTHPANWMISTVPDEIEQAAGYQSLLAAFSDQPWWDGVYWWVWNALPDNGSDHATNFSPRGKSAEAVLRQWWL